MKGNNGKGNIPERDEWETNQEFWNKLNEQYNFNYDCCAKPNNSKCTNYAARFEEAIDNLEKDYGTRDTELFIDLLKSELGL